MSREIKYPEQWSRLVYPNWRYELMAALGGVATTSVEELERRRVPGEIGDFIEEAYSLFFDTFELDRRGAVEMIGEELFDEAEAQAVDRVAAVLRRLFKPSPMSEEAFAHPQWREAAEAAARACELLSRRGGVRWSST